MFVSVVTVLAVLQVVVEPAGACSRFGCLGRDGKIFTARSMDWEKPIGTNLYILPRGMVRNGEVGPDSIRWTSKYGSLVATAFDNSTSDGVNEEGLTANVLSLEESQYPAFDGKGTPGLAISVWAQYALDNFATVDEAVAALEKQPFTLVTRTIPGTQVIASIHMSLSDSGGDSAIIEYIDGQQVIHHRRQY
ncbi:choloylglycine hydrolase [Methylobacterium sp. AMS5]|nr:choloylglycine hydrolase [Methylobacterium sp. AMS5]